MGGPSLKERVMKAYLDIAAGYCRMTKDVLEELMQEVLEDDARKELDGVHQENEAEIQEEKEAERQEEKEAERQEEKEDEAMDALVDTMMHTMDATLHDLLENAKQVMATRRLPPVPVQKSSPLPLVFEEYMVHDPKRFQRNLRVSPETFRQLERKLAGNPVFHPRDGVLPQLPVRSQLAITLFRFGHEGSACGTEYVAQWAGVCAGMVTKATRRVMQAVLSFHDEAICWASPAEKEEAKRWVEERSCRAWRGGYCMVDGTLVPLFQKPTHFGEGYFDRKSNYSLNVQVCRRVGTEH
jgi:hypothetical protein